MGSNRNWPNLFKAKASSEQRQISTSFTMSARRASADEGTSSSLAMREKAQPRARWHPLPVQWEILEDTFNAGLENPDKDDIRRITKLLRAYGDVEEGNVFFWFRNKKARTRRKQRLDSESSSAPTSGEGSDEPPSASLPQQTNETSCASCPNSATTVEALQNDNTIVHTESGISFGISFDASMERINVKALFGDNAVLLYPSGQPVPVDGEGFILKELLHQTKFYLKRV